MPEALLGLCAFAATVRARVPSSLSRLRTPPHAAAAGAALSSLVCFPFSRAITVSNMLLSRNPVLEAGEIYGALRPPQWRGVGLAVLHGVLVKALSQAFTNVVAERLLSDSLYGSTLGTRLAQCGGILTALVVLNPLERAVRRAQLSSGSAGGGGGSGGGGSGGKSSPAASVTGRLQLVLKSVRDEGVLAQWRGAEYAIPEAAVSVLATHLAMRLFERFLP